MPSRVLETVLTGRNLLSPTLTKAAADVEGFDAKVTAASTRASAAADASSKAQATAAERVVAANTRTASSSEAMAAKVRASQAKASESTRAFADVTESSAARSAAAWSSFATKGLPLAAAAVAVVTGKMAADYQTNLVKLETTAGESARNIGMVGQGMLTMAGQVGVSAQDLSKAMYTVDSAGIHGADSLKVLRAAAEGARQENADLSKVTDAVTTALHDYHLPASQAAKVTSELITAVSHGKTTFDELTGSLHSVTPLASKLGISLADVTGTLSAMTASGESADQATQNMADTLRHLANPTNTMISELAQLGISTTDLSNSLSTRGLAGTLQYVSDAIVQHVDPATRKVLLPALNQSKAAAQDLQIMIGKMPPQLAAWSKALLDGTMTQKDFRKAALELGGTAGVMGDQFLSLYKSSDGFNQVLKAGGPAEQVFEAAMAKAIGTSAGLNVMLQTTGENAGATNAAIKDIASSSAQADGNIKGWSEVQHTFNQQLHEAEAAAGAAAIQLGQHLLPAGTALMGWVAHDAIPGLEHLGGAVGGAVHQFMALPGPIRDTAYALAALKVADRLGLFSGITSGAGKFKAALTETRQELANSGVSLRGFGDEMRLQQALWEAEQKDAQLAVGNLGNWQRAMGATEKTTESATRQFSTAQKVMWDWDTTLQGTGASAEQAGKGLSKMGDGLDVLAARASGAAKGGLSALKTAGSGVVNMLGGSWGAGIAGATLAIGLYEAALEKAKQTEDQWVQAMKTGGTALEQANQQMQRATEAHAKLDHGAASFGLYMMGMKNAVEGVIPSAQSARKAYDDWYHSLSGVDRASQDVQKAQAKLNEYIDKYGPASLLARQAATDYQGALARQKAEQDQLNQSEKTHLQLLQDTANADLDRVNKVLAAAQGQAAFNQQLDQFNKDAADGQHTAAQLNTEQLDVAQSALQWASSAGEAAAAQAKANGITDTANASNQAQLQVLQQVAKQMGDATPQAIKDAITALQNATVSTDDLSGAIHKMGLNTVTESSTFRQEWGTNVQVLHGATQAQIADLDNLGYTVLHLPNGDVVVSADTSKARQALAQLTQDYTSYSINLGVKVGSGHFAAADGGILPGYTPGRDVHTFTSPSGGALALSGGEAIMRPEFTRAVGPGWIHGMNAAARTGGVSGVRSALGFADGGVFPMWLTANVGIDPGSYAAAETAIKQAAAAASPYAGMVAGATSQQAVQMGARLAAARGWNGPQFMDLFSLWMRESGWNPYAVNPSSGAYGIPQALGHGHPFNLGDIAAQETWGMDYIAGRYGTPANAWAHEVAFGWYDQGGPLHPGWTLAYNGTGHTEQVVNPAAPAMPGYGTPFSGATFGPAGPATVVEKHYHLTITNTGQPITGAKLMGSIRELEWLGGDT